MPYPYISSSQSANTRPATPGSSQQRITDIYTGARKQHANTRANDDPRKKELNDMLDDPNWQSIKDATQAHRYLKSQGLTTVENSQNYQIRDIAKTLFQLTYFPASEAKIICNSIRSIALMLITLESTIDDLIKNDYNPSQPQSLISNTEDLIQRIELAAEMTKNGSDSATRALNEAKALSDNLATQNARLEHLATSLSDEIKKSLETVADSLVQNIKSAASEANDKVTTASKAINEATIELNAAKKTYSQVARTPPTPSRLNTANYSSPLIEDENERQTRDRAQRGILNRQILINPKPRPESTEGNVTNHTNLSDISLEGLKEKANDALKKTASVSDNNEHINSGIKFVNAKKLPNGGIVLEINNDEAASLLRNEGLKQEFLKHFDPDNHSFIKEREYQIIAFGVPIHFEIDSNEAWREVEDTNTKLDVNSIIKARWVKPPRRRTVGQQRANVIFHFNNPRSANYAILKGLYISGRSITCERIKKEPLRCMKCQLYDHLANKCTAQESCSQCGNNHDSKHCTNKEHTHCVACNADTHCSWDRTCPVFLEKCDKLNERLLENSRPFFPIDNEPWTLASIPPDTQRQDRTKAIRNKIEEIDKIEQNQQSTILDAFKKAKDKQNRRPPRANDNNNHQMQNPTPDEAELFGWNLRQDDSMPPIIHSPRIPTADSNTV